MESCWRSTFYAIGRAFLRRDGLHINTPVSAKIGYIGRNRRDSRGGVTVQNRESDENTPI